MANRRVGATGHMRVLGAIQAEPLLLKAHCRSNDENALEAKRQMGGLAFPLLIPSLSHLVSRVFLLSRMNAKVARQFAVKHGAWPLQWRRALKIREARDEKQRFDRNLKTPRLQAQATLLGMESRANNLGISMIKTEEDLGVQESMIIGNE